MTWSDLIVIDNPEPAALTDAASLTLRQLAADVENARQRWETHLANHGFSAGDADRYDAARHHSLHIRARPLIADPPEWLTSTLGHRPTDQAGSMVWETPLR